jgi:hypothetical protein
MNATQVDHSAEDDAVRRAYQATREAAGGSAVDAAFPDEPPASIDNAIRAAARRAVHARPQAVGKSWFTRYRTPLSAAAVVMLSASLLMVAFNERADLRPDSTLASTAQKAPVVANVQLEPAAGSASPNRLDVAQPQVRAEVAGNRISAGEPAPPIATGRNQPLQESKMAIPTPPLARAPEAKQKPVPETIQEYSASPSAPKPAEKSAIATRGSVSEPASQPSMPPQVLAAPATPAAPPPAAAVPVIAPVVAPVSAPVVATAPAPAVAFELPVELAAKPAAKKAEQDTTARTKEVKADSGSGAKAEDVKRRESMQVLARAADKTPDAAAVDPFQAWITRLTGLKRAGKDSEFRDALAQFRKLYPRREIPSELTEYAAALQNTESEKTAEPK